MVMRFSKRMSVVSCAALLASCASGGPDGPRGGERRPIGVDQPSALLSHARDLHARQGCAPAAPVYRIVSSYGEGHEVAQYELGVCLLSMDGANDAETALFRQEGLFWLSRAAWAGNPRAQAELAKALSGAPAYSASHVMPDLVAAMKWNIIYEANGARDIYGLRPLPEPVIEYLNTELSSSARKQAELEAAAFSRITMAGFSPMAREGGQQAGQRDGDGQGPGGGKRHPRRQ